MFNLLVIYASLCINNVLTFWHPLIVDVNTFNPLVVTMFYESLCIRCLTLWQAVVDATGSSTSEMVKVNFMAAPKLDWKYIELTFTSPGSPQISPIMFFRCGTVTTTTSKITGQRSITLILTQAFYFRNLLQSLFSSHFGPCTNFRKQNCFVFVSWKINSN